MGRALVERLLSFTANDIVAVTSKSHLGGCSGSRLIVANSANWEQIVDEVSKASIVVNCAFPRNVDGTTMASGLRYIDRIFSIVGMNRNCALINISSQSVYSQRDPIPANEESDVCLESSYAVAKYATELLLDARCRNNQRTNIRLASLIGPGFNQRVVNKMVMKALRGETISVLENGSRFGYLDVRDAAEAIAALCMKANDAHWKRTYNVGTSAEYSLTEIARLVRKVCERRHNIEIELSIKKSKRPAVYSQICASQFTALTGWLPKYSLEETITEIAKDLESSNSF